MFEKLEMLPQDPVLGIPLLFNQDPRPKKVNLSVGAYQDGEGRPYVLESVRDTESFLAKQKLLKNYLPIEGDPDYIRLAADLVFGKIEPARFCGAQTVGGTSALRLGADLLKRGEVPCIALSNPSWPNHAPLFHQAGLKVVDYAYYDDATHQIDFTGLISSLENLPKNSVVLLHACCHNPTGMDLNFSQWEEVAQMMVRKGLVPFFDLAYQGFSEDLEADARAIRLFVEHGLDLFVATSFSKNMGLYGERAGFLGILVKPEVRGKVESHMKRLIRANYSNPPIHPARIVTTLLKDPQLRKEWERELSTLRDRINCMREALAFGLASKGANRDFGFLLKQRGVFSYSGLTPQEVGRLKEEWGIYLLSNGRMNVAGLNPGNLDTVIEAIIAVTHAH